MSWLSAFVRSPSSNSSSVFILYGWFLFRFLTVFSFNQISCAVLLFLFGYFTLARWIPTRSQRMKRKKIAQKQKLNLSVLMFLSSFVWLPVLFLALSLSISLSLPLSYQMEWVKVRKIVSFWLELMSHKIDFTFFLLTCTYRHVVNNCQCVYLMCLGRGTRFASIIAFFLFRSRPIKPER